MKISAWVDNGANIHSKRTFDLEFDDEDWKRMDDKEKEDLVRESIFQYVDWGYEEQGE